MVIGSLCPRIVGERSAVELEAGFALNDLESSGYKQKCVFINTRLFC